MGTGQQGNDARQAVAAAQLQHPLAHQCRAGVCLVGQQGAGNVPFLAQAAAQVHCTLPQLEAACRGGGEGLLHITHKLKYQLEDRTFILARHQVTVLSAKLFCSTAFNTALLEWCF